MISLFSRVLLVTLMASFAPCAQAASWVPVGPADASHRPFDGAPQYGSVATHPTAAGHAVVLAGGPATLRPFVTTDSGAHWTSAPPVFNGGSVILAGIPAVLFLPATPPLSDQNLRSTDLGRSWAPVPMPVGATKNAVLRGVNPANPDELIVTDRSHVFQTTDGGRTWTSDDATNDVWSLAVDWSTRTMYVAFNPFWRLTYGFNLPVAHRPLDARGSWGFGGIQPSLIAAGHGVALLFDGYATTPTLYRSADGGATYGGVAGGIDSLDICAFAFSALPATRVYATECSGGRILRSDDDGTTWEVASTQPDSYLGSLAIDAANPDRVYVVSAHGLWVSDDGATTFSRLDRKTGAPGDFHLIYFDQSVSGRQWLSLYSGFVLSVLRSSDSGSSWFEINTNHRLVATSRTRANTLFGTQLDPASGSDRRFDVSTNGGASWSTKFQLTELFARIVSIAYGQAPGEVFVASLHGETTGVQSSKIHYSINDGDSFSVRAAPPIQIRGLASAQTGTARLYAAGDDTTGASTQLYRSDDGAQTWHFVTTLPAGRSAVDPAWPNALTALSVDPADPDRLYAGFYFPDYVLRSDDGGATWRRATIGLGAGPVTSLVIDPTNPATMYASQLDSGVFRSTDGGSTWSAMDDGLADDSVYRVALDPHGAGRLHAETLTGLFRADLSIGIPGGSRRAIEYHHRDFNHYFLSADSDEIAALDAGVFSGWTRTGEGFPVAEFSTPGNESVCRFFGVGFAPMSSHFYTPYAQECELLRSNSAWLYERMAFGLALPASNTHGCPAGTRAINRLWNRNERGAPNHRYTTNKYVFDSMITAGWVMEGEASTFVFACVPN